MEGGYLTVRASYSSEGEMASSPAWLLLRVDTVEGRSFFYDKANINHFQEGFLETGRTVRTLTTNHVNFVFDRSRQTIESTLQARFQSMYIQLL